MGRCRRVPGKHAGNFVSGSTANGNHAHAGCQSRDPCTTLPFLKSAQVAKGFDVADHEIVRRARPGDLIITSDIPLAAEVVAAGCTALSPRGELFTRENVRARLNMRDFMDTLRASGTQTGGPAAMSATEQRQFANALDRLLRKGSSNSGKS